MQSLYGFKKYLKAISIYYKTNVYDADDNYMSMT